MGKATRWFRSLLGGGKPNKSLPLTGPTTKKDSSSNTIANKYSKKNKGIPRSSNNNDGRSSFTHATAGSVDANKHALAVAAATAAVAEAALAAAQAAAEVVRLTSGGGRGSYGGDRRKEWAAVVVQSAFRAYLARRALKALKALVKLQALVRGHFVRKQSANMLQRMQAMARIQALACAHRAYVSESPHCSSKSSHSHLTGVSSPKIFDHQLHAYGSRTNGTALKNMQRSSSKSSIRSNTGPERKIVGSDWLDHWMEENSWHIYGDTSLTNAQADDEKSDKILEVDTCKPHMNFKQGDQAFPNMQHFSSWNDKEKMLTPFYSLTRQSTKSQRPNPGQSQDPLNLRSLKLNQEFDQAVAWAAENSPGAYLASSRPGSSSRRGPSTPARSELSQSFYSNYMGHPNYMATTESSQAKARSQSAPRQRMDFEKSGSTKRFVRGYWDEETSSERGWPLQGNFRGRAYTVSGRSEKLGMPSAYSSTYGGR